jgi:hypothetical protein
VVAVSGSGRVWWDMEGWAVVTDMKHRRHFITDGKGSFFVRGHL